MPSTSETTPLDATSIPARAGFLELADVLRDAARAYYAGDGNQLMDDAAYDAAISRLRSAAAAHPDWDDAVDLLETVAAGTAAGDVPHDTPMLSLENAMDEDELRAFFERVAKITGIPSSSIAWTVEPKLDGMALSIRYQDGKLSRIVTRGSGRAGEDVTASARGAKAIPTILPTPQTIEVRGECVLSHDDFAVANESRMRSGKPPFANPRNAVAGSLRSLHRTYAVPLTFIAYSLVTDGPQRSYSDAMAHLEQIGFTTARSTATAPERSRQLGSERALLLAAEIEQRRSTLPFDIDGAVVKADDASVQAACGATSRAPRWAIARKFAPDTRETALIDIEVSVGRTGNLSFTAKLEPVYVGGVTVSSATVHNPSQISRKGLRLPGSEGVRQRVWVRRAGDVIPELVGPLDDSTDGTVAFDAPATCPRCGGELDTDSLIWRCRQGRNCAIEAGIRYAVGRDQLDLAFADKTVRALVKSGRVRDVADLFSLTVPELLALERMGDKVASKIVESVEAAKRLPMNRVFCALGVAMTGRSMSRRIAKHFGTMDRLRSATLDQLSEVEGVGPERAASIRDELEVLSTVLDRLAGLDIGQSEPEEPASLAPLAGETVVVTGIVPGFSRSQAQAAVERLGGRSSSTISSKTTLVVMGDGAGGKAAKAEQLKIRMIPADEFAQLAARP